ncbi:hypothetical protein YDYSG_53480 [Paenibacillus tyrfis]|uniref:hypothetical protein n=1 Tax=Paenibacillus tyrfis TaxID=1501230 RepID=UPI002491CF45|nr:hypothetical protein [Paenibacillus tyrfis]GLI09316.1 hypothetical protein YDYSG_53480 [Paenibacillus tyrfis]
MTATAGFFYLNAVNGKGRLFLSQNMKKAGTFHNPMHEKSHKMRLFSGLTQATTGFDRRFGFKALVGCIGLFFVSSMIWAEMRLKND